MSSINTICYSAGWNASNLHLKPLHMQEISTLKKVVGISTRIFTFPFVYPIKSIARRAILPSSSKVFHEIIIQSTQDFETEAAAPELSRIKVRTPDGITLKGHFLEGKNFKTNPNRRVVILFHGNGDFYQSGSYRSGIASILTPHEDYSFLMFNPRGIGISDQMPPSEKTLILDGESIYQLAIELGFREDQIDITGHSLGAAVAAQLKKLHPKTGGRLILDRSFDSLGKQINSLFPNPIGRIASFTARQFGWKLETSKALEEIKDEVFIINHCSDEVIKNEAALTEENLGDVAVRRNLHIYNITQKSQNNHMDPPGNFYEISRSLARDLNLGKEENKNLSA